MPFDPIVIITFQLWTTTYCEQLLYTARLRIAPFDPIVIITLQLWTTTYCEQL